MHSKKLVHVRLSGFAFARRLLRRLRRQFNYRQSRRSRLLMTILTTILFLKLVYSGEREIVYRALPRLLRGLRRNVCINWTARLRKAQSAPKYPNTSGFYDLRVISLNRTSGRKSRTISSITRQGINYTMFAAIDGLRDLSAHSVQLYAGAKKRRRMRLATKLSDSERTRLYDKYRRREFISRATRSALHERLRFGCYMSHVALWHILLEQGTPFMIVLEDDIELVDDFLPSFQRKLAYLPEDWGMVYLNGCFRHLGHNLGSGLFLSHGGLCTYGYAISALAASIMLNGPALNSEKPVDHMLDEAVMSGEIMAFHVNPPMVEVVANTVSTLAY